MITPFLNLLLQIQQIPAPTFAEAQRASFVLEQFRSEGWADTRLDEAGNVYARIPGRGTSRPLVVSAHLDTVFPIETNLATRRDGERLYGPGIGDNSLGVAGLFGLGWWLRQRQITPTGDIWLVANTCEEGLGDLKGMKAVCDHFGASAQGYLVLEGMAFGAIYHRAIGVQRYKVTCHTQGGHSWGDFGKPSAIHELSALITRLGSLHLPSQPRTTYNVGRIGGGTSVNTLAASAWMELDLRSEGEAALQELVRQACALVMASEKTGVRFELEEIGRRPAGALDASHSLVRHAEACLRQQGFSPRLAAGSTDANIPLSLGYPALVLGISQGGGAHTVEEYVDTGLIEQGLDQIGAFISQL